MPFLAISPHARHVNLQFTRGVELPDPARLLEGTGKSMRHIKVRSQADIERPELAALIGTAAERSAR
jgi:hypothetical protein